MHLKLKYSFLDPKTETPELREVESYPAPSSVFVRQESISDEES
jgi:hypothetical protein